ncbi:unnamed protein product, partial [Larinioides sclopetarius]
MLIGAEFHRHETGVTRYFGNFSSAIRTIIFNPREIEVVCIGDESQLRFWKKRRHRHY